MGMQINTNMAALNAYRNLNSTQNDLSKSLEKLSSGFRINRAADDAAGLAISEGLKSQIGGLAVASRNAQDGISLIQTAEGSLAEVHTILQRMRDLAVQAANDTNSSQSRDAISKEVTNLQSELSRIADSTKFNGISLLDGLAGTKSFQVGVDGNASSYIDINLGSTANVKAIATALTSVYGPTTFSTVGASVGGNAQTFTIDNGDGSTTSVTTAALGAGVSSAADVVAALNNDANFKAHLKATLNGTSVEVSALNGKQVDAGNTNATAANGLSGGSAGSAAAISFSTAADARAAIGTIDTQITTVSTARADLGALQNRFESAVRSLAVTKENLTAANSRIRDVDMAEEMVNFTRSQILSQAGTAMLAQANQSNQGVLQLLR